MGDQETHSTSHGGLFVLHDKIEKLAPHDQTSHTEYGLTFLVQGHMRMEHGSEVRAGPGSLTIVPGGVPHQPLEGKDMEYWMVGFCPTCVELDESQLLMSPFRLVRLGHMPVLQLEEAQQERLLKLIRQLREELERAEAETPELARCLLLLILGEIRRAMPASATPTAAVGPVGDALVYIQQHCLDGISLKEVATAVGRSPAHLTSTVKKATGYSVGEWITAGRIAEAAQRLLHTDDSIDEIAGHVGWQDTTHFIRQFRKSHNCTPAAWRREQRPVHKS